MTTSTVSDFKENVKIANKDEQFITELFNLNDLDNVYEWVGKEKDCYYNGDIRIISGDNVYYADVKTDDTCYKTGNILAEHRIKWRDKGWTDGFMIKSNYDFVVYLSKTDKKIYVIDFKRWKKKYKKRYKKHILIPHNDKYGNWLQSTDGYLMSIKDAKSCGVIISELEYTDDMNIKNYKGAGLCWLLSA